MKHTQEYDIELILFFSSYLSSCHDSLCTYIPDLFKFMVCERKVVYLKSIRNLAWLILMIETCFP